MGTPEQPSPKSTNIHIGSVLVSPRQTEISITILKDEFETLCEGETSETKGNRDFYRALCCSAAAALLGLLASADWGTFSERKHVWPFFLIAVLFVLAIGIFGTAWNFHSKHLDRVSKHSHYARVKDRMSSQFAALEKSAAAEHDKNPRVPLIPLTLKGGLKARAKALADELIEFLDECGPRPGFEVNESMTPTDILGANREEIGAWVEKIHYTYLAQFKDPLTQVVNELHACGIADHELDALIDPQVQNADRMRTISEKLRILADRIKE